MKEDFSEEREAREKRMIKAKLIIAKKKYKLLQERLLTNKILFDYVQKRDVDPFDVDEW